MGEQNLKYFRGKEYDGVEWFYLAEDTDKWQALAKTAIKFMLYKRQGIS
jgi:hypothetical protein